MMLKPNNKNIKLLPEQVGAYVIQKLFASCNVGCVEEVMSLVAAGFAEIFIVDLLNDGVLVRLTVGGCFVLGVEGSSSERFKINMSSGVSIMERLTAAVYAAAGTSHDFDKVVMSLTFFNFGEELACVSGAADNSNLNFGARNGVGSFFDTFDTANFFVINGFSGFVFKNFNNGSESSFHNAAGSAEDVSRTGSAAEDRIEFFIGKSGEVETCGLDHTSKFAGCDGNIDIVEAVNLVLFTGAFEFLSGTGHNGNNGDRFGIDAHLFSVVALHESAVHTLRRFSGRKVGNEFGEVVFAVLNPTGRAGSDEGKRTFAVKTFDKFCAFFHDGDVSRNVNINNRVEAESVKSCNHFTFNIGADGHVKAFAEGCSDSGSGSNNNVFIGIGESIPNLPSVVLFVDSANGAVNNALTASDTGNVFKVETESGTDIGYEASFISADNANALNVLTHSNATTAKNAFIVISYEVGVGVFDSVFRSSACKTVNVFNAVFLTESLKFAVLVSYAGKTFFVMGGKDKLKSSLSGLSYSGSVGENFHVGSYGINAGSNEGSCALNFNNADTASADSVDIFEEAESGNFYTNGVSRVENGCSGRNSDGQTVNF